MRVHLLGSLEVRDGGGELIDVRGAKLRRLLAILALDAGRVVGTDRLIECIWGDDLPLKVDNALQVLVSKLRHTLDRAGAGAPRVVTRAPGYLLDVDADHIDTLRFGALVAQARAQLEGGSAEEATRGFRQALALWRGPALADFVFDDFAAGERARLEELRLSATEDCIGAELGLGRHARCVGELEQLVSAHPLRERLWGQLMVALYRSGRQAEALRVYQEARKLLSDELGIEPGPELRRLDTAILAQDPSLDLADRRSGTPGPAAGAPGSAPPAEHPPANAASPGPTAGNGATTSRAPGNVTRPLTECLGRQDDLAAIHRLLGSHRLVTLVGPGGVGKTRLAVEVALDPGLPVGGSAWIVELAPVTEGAGVLPAVRHAVGGPPAATTGPALAAALDSGELLVVLDNCEHVIDEAARLARDLAAGAPQLRLLATSREPLGVPGEVVHPVPPLASVAAVRLFTERAAAAAPAIDFDEAAATAIRDICARLDGLPLAIELAASRARALDLTQIATRLQDRFRLLTAGARTALPRHRTLRAVVDWSYDLLDAQERSLFERLSVFAGGATLEALETVCAGEGVEAVDVADLVSRLIDKSLVSRVPEGAGPRYVLLQTLADYATEQLASAGQVDAYRRRHGAWVLELARAAERDVGTPATVTLTELAAESDNVDAALAWANAHDPILAFELACRMGWFWFWTGRCDVGWRAVSAALEGPAAAEISGALRSRAWTWAGMFGIVMDVPDAMPMVERGVEEARASGHQPTLGAALGTRAALRLVHGHASRASEDLEEVERCFAGSADRYTQGLTWRLRGVAAMIEGRFEDAERAYAHAIDHFRATGDEWAAGLVLQRVAELAERQGRFDEAALALEGAVARAKEIPNRFAQALVVTQLASVRLGQGRLEEAAALADEAVGRGQTNVHAAVATQASHVRGRIALRIGRLDQAEADLNLALQRYRSQGYHGRAAACLSDLGRIATARGDHRRAVERHGRAAAMAAESEDQMVTLSAVEGLALALAAAGQGERAGRLLGAADALRQAGARPLDPNVDEREPALTATADLVGAEALADLRAAGRSAPLASLLDGTAG